jgi:hypothetical protein
VATEQEERRTSMAEKMKKKDKRGTVQVSWTKEEDRIIFNAVTTSLYQPFTCWDDLVDHQGILPDKMRKQIRDRWVNHLNPKLNHRPFTDEDDLILWKGQRKLGNKWVEISVNYFHSTRSDNHCRNRWYSPAFRKFINKTFLKKYEFTFGWKF